MVYLFCYISSCLFAWLDFFLIKKNRQLAYLFAAIAVFIPCFLAGIRNPVVGTDVNVYVTPIIKLMQISNNSLNELILSELFEEETNGVFFTTLLYFCSKFKNGLKAALFLIELFTLLPVYIVIRKQKYTEILKVLSLFSYYCLFYHYSLNLMKQCIAIGLTFLGWELVKKRKVKAYFLLVIILALFVHKSALIALLVYITYIVSVDKKELLFKDLFNVSIRFEKRSKKRKKNYIFLCGILAVVFVIFNIRPVLVLLATVKHSYMYQLSHMTEFKLKISNFLIMSMIIIPPVIFHRKTLMSDSKYHFYFNISVLSAVLYQFVGVSPALYRLSLYSMIFLVLIIPEYVDLFKKNGKIIMTAYYGGVLLANFVFDVIMNSYAGVYPYQI